MAFIEYLLLVVLGSVGAAVPGGTARNPPTRILDSDTIVQPSGGAADEGRFSVATGMIAQATSGSPGKQIGIKKRLRNKLARSHRTTARHSGATGNSKSPKGKDKK